MPNRIPEEALINRLKEFADKLGHRPTIREMEDSGPHSAQTYKARFGSWHSALDAAGFDTSVRIEDSTLISALQKMADELGRPPRYDEMRIKGPHSTSVFESRFGSWGEALEEAGLDPDRSRETIQREDWASSEEVLGEIHSLGKELGRAPTVSEMRSDGGWSPGVAQSIFGSWNEAIEAAGFTPNRPGKPSGDGGFYSDAELLDSLREFADELGRQPTSTEMEQHGPHSPTTYQNRFGSWNAAIEKVGFNPMRVWGGKEVECLNCGESFRKTFSNAQRHEEHFCDSACMGEFQSESFSGEGNPRWLGGCDNYYGENWEEKRLECLRRDDFQCQDCGLSREEHRKQYQTDIHVHHIQKHVKFDDPADANQLENLATLCRNCHWKWERISPLRPDVAE